MEIDNKKPNNHFFKKIALIAVGLVVLIILVVFLFIKNNEQKTISFDKIPLVDDLYLFQNKDIKDSIVNLKFDKKAIGPMGLSHDSQKVAYILESKNQQREFRIYDLVSDKLIGSYNCNPDREFIWSYDSKYIALKRGFFSEDPNNSEILIIDVLNKKIIYSAPDNIDNSFFWTRNNSLLIFSRGGEVSIVDPKNGKKSILEQVSDLFITQWLINKNITQKNNSFEYARSEYQVDLNGNKTDIVADTYWSIDLDTLKKDKIDYPTFDIFQETSNMLSSVVTDMPNQEQGFIDVVSRNFKYPNWISFTFLKFDSNRVANESDTYIINLDNPTNTLRKLNEGQISWVQTIN